MWCHCRCRCGKTTDTTIYSLQSNNTRSCGCYHREQTSKRNRLLESEIARIAGRVFNKYETKRENNCTRIRGTCHYGVQHSNWISLHDIQQGSGCSCNKNKGISEEKVRICLESLTGLEWPNSSELERLSWLGAQSLDCYNAEHNKAVEYSPDYTHNNQPAIERDATKRRLCRANGVDLFSITVDDHQYKDLDTYIWQQAQNIVGKFQIPVVNGQRPSFGDVYKKVGHQKQKTIEDRRKKITAYCQSKGGSCDLSDWDGTVLGKLAVFEFPDRRGRQADCVYNNMIRRSTWPWTRESQEFRQKLSEAHERKPFYAVHIIKAIKIGPFQTQAEGARATGASPSRISACLLGKQKSTKGYRFEFA